LRQLLFSINPDFDHFADMQAYFTELATSFFAQSEIKIHFEMKSDNFSHKVDRIVKSQLMLIYKEILNNISKHANATNVIIALNLHEPGKYILYVKDDGMGFDLEEIKMFSTGLSNIKARCERIHANLDIVSERNAGVEISIIGPIFNI
jgi:signal transduction histidine kinase